MQVIGLGIDNPPVLSSAARKALQQAEVIIGAANAFTANMTSLTAKIYPYPKPMQELWPLLEQYAGQHIVLLGSGDPLFYGIGALLLRYLPPEQVQFHPHVSSIQAAFARIKRPWQDATIMSLHGRPLLSLRAALKTNQLYGLLTDSVNNPMAIAQLVHEAGLGDSILWIAENLGLPEEQVHCFQAAELAAKDLAFAPLNVTILETRGPGGILPEFPGISDENFVTDGETGRGMISKREVRLMVLSLLSPRADEIGWDVGAGCGGVAVEWSRWNPHGALYAVECHEQRLACLAANRERFGVVNNLHIIAGHAPEALATLPPPNTVFIGGSKGRLLDMLQIVWQRLLPGGRLVASAVTENSRMDLYRFAGEQTAYFTELSIAREDRLGGQRVLRPYLPVLLMQLIKSEFTQLVPEDTVNMSL
jgi:precorrin-6Y C5,15-methyltransferase (decarboxylating)